MLAVKNVKYILLAQRVLELQLAKVSANPPVPNIFGNLQFYLIGARLSSPYLIAML